MGTMVWVILPAVYVGMSAPMSMGTAWRVAESMQVAVVGKKSSPPVNCCGVENSGTLKENAPAASVMVVLFTVPTVKMTC